MKTALILIAVLTLSACVTAPQKPQLTDWRQGLTPEQIQKRNEDDARRQAKEWADFCANHPNNFACKSHTEFDQMWQNMQQH